MEEVGELGGEFGTNLVTLQSATCREDGDFGHGSTDIDGSGRAFEFTRCLDVLLNFLFDQGDVGFQGFLAKSELDELQQDNRLARATKGTISYMRGNIEAYLLLLHQFRVRTIIDDIGTEDRRGQLAIYLFGIDIL